MRRKYSELKFRHELDSASSFFREIGVPFPVGLREWIKLGARRTAGDLDRILTGRYVPRGWKRKQVVELLVAALSEATGDHKKWLAAHKAIDVKQLKAIPAGRDAAKIYHDFVFKILSAIFEGDLSDGKTERPAAERREVIDIMFRNIAEDGFFKVSQTSGCAKPVICDMVPFECKNYSPDLGPKEFDQIASRLNQERRMTMGFVTCRKIGNLKRALGYCKDKLQDGKYVIMLTDEDLVSLWDARFLDNLNAVDAILMEKLASLRFGAT